MSFEQQEPYRNEKGDTIDFEKKRLEFWLENVPSDIRRYEYDLWRRYRELFHVLQYEHKASIRSGRMVNPTFTQEVSEESWKEFKDSFLLLQELAVHAHRVPGCRGYSRSDFILANGIFYILETNTLAGLTSASLLPQQAAAAGISFSQLLNRIIQNALL